jgi:hypothetical protein
VGASGADVARTARTSCDLPAARTAARSIVHAEGPSNDLVVFRVNDLPLIAARTGLDWRFPGGTATERCGALAARHDLFRFDAGKFALVRLAREARDHDATRTGNVARKEVGCRRSPPSEVVAVHGRDEIVDRSVFLIDLRAARRHEE